MYLTSPQLSLLLHWCQTVVWAQSARFPDLRELLVAPTASGIEAARRKLQAEAAKGFSLTAPDNAASMAYASPAAHTHKTAARFAGGVRASSSSSLLYSAYFKPFIVDNFTSSFSDGVVLCLIINYYYPHLLPLQQIAFPNDPLAIASDVPPTPAAQRHDPRAGAWAGSIDYNALTVTESPLARHKRQIGRAHG